MAAWHIFLVVKWGVVFGRGIWGRNKIWEFWRGLSRIPRVQVVHCFREVNKCADALARRGALLSSDFCVFNSPPADVAFLLSLDAAGVLYERSFAPVSVP